MAAKKKSEFKSTPILFVIIVVLVVLHFLQKNNSDVGKSSKGEPGVLVFNTNKSVYKPNERVNIGIVTLDHEGETLCRSDLTLVIEYPTGQEMEMSTSDHQITYSGTCSEDNNVTNDADYKTHFTPPTEGTYKIIVKNHDDGAEIEKEIEVAAKRAFDIERIGAIRINPEKSDRYPMAIKITASKDFKGTLEEYLPLEFEPMWIGEAKYETKEDLKTLTWEIDIKAGETIELLYAYKAPEISPYVYELGQINLVDNDDEIVFIEKNTWLIASDAMRFYLRSSGTAPASPAYDTNWDDTSLGSRMPTSTAPASTTMAYISLDENADAEDTDYMYGQWVSAGLEAQTIPAQTLKFQIRAMQENDRCNQYTAISVRAVSSNGSSVTGTILSLTRDNTEITTSTTTPVNRQFSATTSALSINEGDRIVIEVGTGGDPETGSGGNSHDADLRVGDNGGSDLPENDTDTNDYNAWVEFANEITYQSGAAITGTVYTNEAKSSNVGSNKTIALYANGTSKGTAETNSSGEYEFSGITGISTDDTLIVYIDDETEKGSAISLAPGAVFTLSNFDIITDRVILQSETSSAINNTDLDDVDAVDTGNEDGITISSGALTVASGFELFIPTGEEFAPGNDVTTEKLHVKGTFTAGSGTLTLSGSGTGACNDSQATTLPLCVDSGATFTYGTGTTTFTGTSSSTIENTSYNILNLTPTISGNITYTTDGAITTYGNFTINPTSSGSNTLTVNLGGTVATQDENTLSIYATTSATSNLSTTGTNYAISSGYINIGAGGTLTANGSTITMTGYTSPVFTRTGTFTAGTSTMKFANGNYTACGGTFFASHTTAGGVAPVDKDVYYETVYTDLSGADACWIAQNLGSTDQASSATDSDEDSRGWFWQFNLKQGYKHDGTTRTPNTAWIHPISEDSDWETAKDPCTQLLGADWRIPTQTEWSNANTTSSWGDYNDTYASVLKIHLAGSLYYTQGTLNQTYAYLWSSTQDNNTSAFRFRASSSETSTDIINKDTGASLRCITADAEELVNLSLVSGTINFYNVEIAHNGAHTVSASNLTVTNNLTFTSGALDTTTSDYPITTKNLTISEGATLIANDSTITVSGDWSNSGTFTYDTSDVILSGSGPQQVLGTTTFYDLSATASSARTLTFTSGEATSIAAGGSLTLTGSEGELITLSPTTTSDWYLQADPTATVSVSYVAPKKSDASEYQTIDARDGTSTNLGGNTNWLFPPTLTKFSGLNMSGIKFEHREE